MSRWIWMKWKHTNFHNLWNSCSKHREKYKSEKEDEDYDRAKKELTDNRYVFQSYLEQIYDTSIKMGLKLLHENIDKFSTFGATLSRLLTVSQTLWMLSKFSHERSSTRRWKNKQETRTVWDRWWMLTTTTKVSHRQYIGPAFSPPTL